MKTILLTTLFLWVSFSACSQIMLATDETPEQLIQNTFMGQNLSINSIKFNGSEANAQVLHDQVARFSNGNAGLSADQGLVLCTGNAAVALGPNNNDNATFPTATPFAGDADLAAISAGTVQNVCIIEFDFIPNGNTVLFEYIFASEEYASFANSQFNDTFGLFLSGPGISGPFTNGGTNIALIPGTSLPVSINNLNNGTDNTGPCEYCEFYVNNGTGQTPGINTEVQFDGFTTEFTASGAVVPGQTYHLKFAIANVGDNAFDSAMFLTAGSFRSTWQLANEHFTAEKIKMYPNPASDFIRVSAADHISEARIYDLQGRELKRVQTGGTDIEINIGDLSSGTYVVTLLLGNNEMSSQKLVVK